MHINIERQMTDTGFKVDINDLIVITSRSVSKEIVYLEQLVEINGFSSYVEAVEATFNMMVGSYDSKNSNALRNRGGKEDLL